MSVRRLAVGALSVLALLCMQPADATARLPAGFWGVNPVAVPSDAQVQRIADGGVGSIRVPLAWYSVQPSPLSPPQWAEFDQLIDGAVRAHLEILPVVWGSPTWVALRPLDLPIAHISEWNTFLREAATRYGPGGTFWAEHAAGTPDPLPYDPIRNWQIWNEPNFFYFSSPVSAKAYGSLVVSARKALSSVNPGARLILGGMFATPKESPPRAYSAVSFLTHLYERKGVKRSFDGVALHPYAHSAGVMPPEINQIRATMKEHGDAKTGLWITEIGWGSAPHGPFQKGLQGQARELSRAFSIFRDGRRRWKLEAVDWWSLTDDPSATACNFCGDTGLFTADFHPKPAWSRFSAISHGKR